MCALYALAGVVRALASSRASDNVVSRSLQPVKLASPHSRARSMRDDARARPRPEKHDKHRRSLRTYLASVVRHVACGIWLTCMSLCVGTYSALHKRWPERFELRELARRRRVPWVYEYGLRREVLRTRVNAVRASSEKTQKEHLFVCIHGLAGTPDDLCAMEQRLVRDPRAAVYRVTCNAPFKSFDGVEAGATRIVDELKRVVVKYPGLKRLTVYGNSLGGIYARYAVALMYAEDGNVGTMLGLKPCTFLTTATPHLGVGPYGYFAVVPALARATWSKNLGGSIMELTLSDGHRRKSGQPLLVDMADPEVTEPLNFIGALGAFERRCAFANATNDFLVSYETASISPEYLDPALEHKWRTLESSRVVEEYEHDPDAEDAPLKQPSRDSSKIAFQRRMARGLKTLRWKHVNVAFPGFAPLAHNKICALQRTETMEKLFKEGEWCVDLQAKYLLEPLNQSQ